MSNFTDEELLQIIETGESDAVEFKESLSSSVQNELGKRSALLLTTYQITENRGSFLSV